MPISWTISVKNAACVLSFYRRLVKNRLKSVKNVPEKWAGSFHRVHSISKGGGWYVTDYAGSSRPGTSVPSSSSSDSSGCSSSSE